MNDKMKQLFMTDEEAVVIDKLAQAWNAYLELPKEHGDDDAEFRYIIHTAQDKILGRVGRRQYNHMTPPAPPCIAAALAAQVERRQI